MQNEIKDLADKIGVPVESVECLLFMTANMIDADLRADGAAAESIEEDIVEVVKAYIPAVMRKYREMAVRAHMNPEALCRAVLAKIKGSERAA